MSLLPELRETLAQARKAATRSRNGTRLLAVGGPADRLAAILREIGETILARQLVFAMGPALLVVEAGDGKLRGVVEVDPAEIAHPDIAGKPDASRERQMIAAFAVLSRFAALDGALTVTPRAPELFRGMGLDGLTPDEIVAAETMTAPDPEPAAPPPSEPPKPAPPYEPQLFAPPPGPNTPAGTFYEAAHAFSTARAITAEDGGIGDKAGNDQTIPLEYLLRTFAAQIRMNEPFTDTAMPGPKAIFMGSQTAGMPSVVCFADGANLVVATVGDGAEEQTLDAAASILASTTPEA